MSESKKLSDVLQQQDFDSLIDMIPYARLIGMEVLELGDELVFRLPPSETNIGNPTLPALHGGVVGGFLESAAIFQMIANDSVTNLPKVVDFSLDYLRAARYEDVFCTCHVVRQGRRVANVAATAWQKKRNEPIAVARCHLLLQE
jgi:uncharacterized protein (TIGR00369 family)